MGRYKGEIIMGTLIASVFFNLMILFLFVLIVAFFLTWALNPTATPREIFQHWIKTHEENRKNG